MGLHDVHGTARVSMRLLTVHGTPDVSTGLHDVHGTARVSMRLLAVHGTPDVSMGLHDVHGTARVSMRLLAVHGTAGVSMRLHDVHGTADLSMGLLACPWACMTSMGLLAVHGTAGVSMGLHDVHGTAACRDVREADDVAEVDGDAVELLRFDVSVHLELFDDLPRQHLTQQRVRATLLDAQLDALHFHLLRVFGHFAENTAELRGVPETQRDAGQRDAHQYDAVDGHVLSFPRGVFTQTLNTSVINSFTLFTVCSCNTALHQ